MTSISVTTTSTFPPSSSSPPRFEARLAGGATVLVSTRADGDMRPPRGALAAAKAEAKRRALCDRPWTFVRQVHQDGVAIVEQPSGALELPADALLSRSADVALAMLGADCPLLGLSSAEGVIGAVHAGWRGLLAGVLERAAGEMRALGAGEIHAVVGPFVRKECYPFSPSELELMTSAFGKNVQARTKDGAEALDLEAVLHVGLARAEIVLDQLLGGCTCDERSFSARARGDRGRHSLVIWRGP